MLSLKLAQLEMAARETGEAPILMLDDVMSELDARRRAAISALVGNGLQAVVTTTNLGYFADDLLAEANVVPFGG